MSECKLDGKETYFFLGPRVAREWPASGPRVAREWPAPHDKKHCKYADWAGGSGVREVGEHGESIDTAML